MPVDRLTAHVVQEYSHNCMCYIAGGLAGRLVLWLKYGMATEKSRFDTQQRPSFLCHNTQNGILVHVVSQLNGKLT